MKRWFLACVAMLGFAVAPARAAPPLTAYGKLPAIEAISLSPDGGAIASVAVDGSDRRLIVRYLDGRPLEIFGLKNEKIRNMHWIGDDHLLVEISRTARWGYRGTYMYEWFSEIAVNLKTKNSMVLFHGKDSAFGNILASYGGIQIGGQWFAYVASQSIQRGSARLFKVNLDTGDNQNIGFLDGDASSWVLDGQENIIARSSFDFTTKTWSVLAGAYGDRPVFSKVSAVADLGVAGLGRTPGTVIVRDESEGEDAYLEVDVDKQAPPRPLFTNMDEVELLRARDSKLLIGGVDANKGISVLFDPKLQQRYDAAIQPFKAYRPTLVSYDDSFNHLIIFTNGGDDSGTYWLVDLTAGKASSVAQAYPDIGPADVGVRREIEYKAADGLAIDAILALPPGRQATNLPLVVLPHGGPIGFSDDLGFDWWPQAFASRGYAVLQPNYRGSDSRGAAFRRAGYGEWGRKMQTDISDGVSYLAGQHIIDPKRVCIVGGSYGGYAALYGVTLQHGVYRCAVSYGGVADLAATLDRSASKYQNGFSALDSVAARYNERTMGVTWTGDPTLNARSPLYHAEDADAPILLIHGKDDTVVPISESERMGQALTAAGKPHDFLALDGEDHWLSSSATRTQVVQASVDFVVKNNPPT